MRSHSILPNTQKIEFWVFVLSGLTLALIGIAHAKEPTELKPIYEKEKVTLDSLAQYNSDQFEYLEGKIEYLTRLERKNTDELRDICGK